MKDRLLNDILDRGTVIHYVPLEAGDGVPAMVVHKRPYAYTVGRSMAGKVELLVSGLDEAAAESTLTSVMAWEEKRESDPDLPPSYPGTTLEPCEPAFLLGAIAVFGPIKAMQVVLVDDRGMPSLDQQLYPMGYHPLKPTTDPYGE